MQITDLTAGDLRRLEPLIRRKEKLLARVAGINSQLDAMTNGNAPKVRETGRQQWQVSFPTTNVNGIDRRNWKSGPERAGRIKQPRKGTTLAKVLGALGKASSGGLTVPGIAMVTRLKPGQVSSAIHMNRKRYPGIQRVGRGRYRYVA